MLLKSIRRIHIHRILYALYYVLYYVLFIRILGHVNRGTRSLCHDVTLHQSASDTTRPKRIAKQSARHCDPCTVFYSRGHSCAGQPKTEAIQDSRRMQLVNVE